MRINAFLGFLWCAISSSTAAAAEDVLLTGVPDYDWYAGCFGTAAGNLMGYWDRHGFPDFYTGPTAGGVAPLDTHGSNRGIRSLWASKAGFDGRPLDQPGHIDDYWVRYNDDLDLSYESTEPDPYLTAGRPEHAPDCLSDFIGASQNKWKDLNGECDGNIDAYAVTYWDSTGTMRVNFVPPPQGDRPVLDLPSGLRAWTRHRGYDCDVFSQWTDFNPNVPRGQGFTFEMLKAEIDAGYPIMLFLQRFHETSRVLKNMPKANPNVHGMVAFGYYLADSGARFVRYRTSWGGSGDNRVRAWTAEDWEAMLPVRGVICYRPLPKITSITRSNGTLTVRWHGPSSALQNRANGQTTLVHRYVLEKSTAFVPNGFVAITEPTTDLEVTLTNCCQETAFYRVRLLN